MNEFFSKESKEEPGSYSWCCSRINNVSAATHDVKSSSKHDKVEEMLILVLEVKLSSETLDFVYISYLS